MLRMTVASAKARKSPSLAPIKSILLRVFDLKDMAATLVSYRKQENGGPSIITPGQDSR
jgi:hypothetical protein